MQGTGLQRIFLALLVVVLFAIVFSNTAEARCLVDKDSNLLGECNSPWSAAQQPYSESSTAASGTLPILLAAISAAAAGIVAAALAKSRNDKYD